MARYLIVESRDLQEYTGGKFLLNLTENLQGRGNTVNLFLVENGVLAARKGAEAGARLTALAKKGTSVLAEEAACKARGIGSLAEGVVTGTMDQLADLIVDDTDKVLWY